MFNIEPYQEQTTDGSYGMGCCATIPEEAEIPEHLYELRLPGGDYVVSVWKNQSGPYGTIWELIRDKDWKWEWDHDRIGHPIPGLEEHISRPDGGMIIQAMLPVKKKEVRS